MTSCFVDRGDRHARGGEPYLHHRTRRHDLEELDGIDHNHRPSEGYRNEIESVITSSTSHVKAYGV